MVKEEEVVLDTPKPEVSSTSGSEASQGKEEKVEPEDAKRFKRLPAQAVKIKDLNPDMKRVCVAGTVVSKNDDLYSFLIDDGNGNVLVLLNDVDSFQKVKVGQFVRVFAKIWGEGDEIELQADIVQDFSKIDKDLYTKLF